MGGRGSRGINQGVQLPNHGTNSSNRARLLSVGLELVGFGQNRQKCSEDLCMRRFRAHYGIGPNAIRKLIRDMKQHQHFTPNEKYLFMALSWLRLYDIEEVMAGRFGYGEQHCREKVREYVKRIRDLKPVKISFKANQSPSAEFDPVDTVHIECPEMSCEPSSKWWSHKSNGPAVAFEVVTDSVSGQICWINGPEPPTMGDIKFLRGGDGGKKKGQWKNFVDTWKKSALYFHIPKHVKLVGDSAYAGQPDKVATTKDAHDRQTKELFARMKSLQETVFKRIKDFKIMRHFRHGSGTKDRLEKIKIAFEATAVLVEYDIEYEKPLFEV